MANLREHDDSKFIIFLIDLRASPPGVKKLFRARGNTQKKKKVFHLFLESE